MSKKRKRAAPRLKKQHWIQTTNQYHKDIFVCSGMSGIEMVKTLKRIGAKKWFLDWAISKEQNWQDLTTRDCAFVAREPSHDVFVIRLRDFSDNWKFWETLLHELVHLVDGLAEAQCFQDEYENRAYLTEWLFHEIRRKLSGIVPKNSNSA